MKIMTVRAPDELQQELLKYSKDIGITRNALILFILKNWVRDKIKEENEKTKSDLGRKS